MKRQSDKRLWFLLGLSVALHLAVLGTTWRRTPPELVFNMPPSLSVSLEAIQVAAKTPRQESSPVTKRPFRKPSSTLAKSEAGRNPTPTDKPAQPRPHIARTPTKYPPQINPVAKETMPTTQPQPALDRARILARLHQDFSQHFYYPVLARRRNLQGAVTLGFGINGQGTIYDIQIIKSSGYAILDMAARDAMQQLGQVDWIRQQLHGNSIQIELPVIYRLTNS